MRSDDYYNTPELEEAMNLNKIERSLLAMFSLVFEDHQIKDKSLAVYTNIYLVKGIAEQVDKRIASNEKMEESNDRYANAMNLLTVGLLIVAVVQVVVK